MLKYAHTATYNTIYSCWLSDAPKIRGIVIIYKTEIGYSEGDQEREGLAKDRVTGRTIALLYSVTSGENEG